MRVFARMSLLVVALGLTACSGEVGDSEGVDDAEVTDSVSEALTFPTGFGFIKDAAGAASKKCLNLVDCYLQHDKKVNWKLLNDVSTDNAVFLSEVFSAERTYQAANAPGWNIIHDGNAEDTVAGVTIPGLAESRMLVSGQVDNPNNPNPPGGKRHMFHRCQVQIDFDKIQAHHSSFNTHENFPK